MLDWLKDKYYWYKVNKKLSNFLKIQDSPKILLFGYPKSGIIWLRFLIYNYRNLLIDHDVNQTISYDRLNSLKNNVMDRGTVFLSEKGFPFKYELKEETINFVLEKISEFKNVYPNLIE